MPLRPASARWFELLTAKEQLEPALRALADSGEVELQSQLAVSAPQLVPSLLAAVDEYHHLAQSYQPYWPAPAGDAPHHERELAAIAGDALARLKAWTADAAPLVTRLQQGEAQLTQLREIQVLWSRDGLPDLTQLAQAGPTVVGRIHLLDAGSEVPELPPLLLSLAVDAGATYLLTLGEARDIAALDEILATHKARRLQLPQGLPAGRTAALVELAAREQALREAAQEIRAQLAELSVSHGVAGALTDLALVEWLLAQVPEMGMTEHFGWITGWTSAACAHDLEQALAAAGVPHVLRFADAPADTPAPVVLRNPRWAKPFELFERLLGIPLATEADPSMILALMAPLMFGFMFGDVGQGAVLMLAGIALRRRLPMTAILIPGGFAAMVFGVLFGSVFAREDLLPALWLHPLEKPLAPLIVSLAFGACVLLLGLLLDALQHAWAGRWRLWWQRRAGLLVAYLGMLGCALSWRSLWLTALGLVWFCLGSSLGAGDRLGRLAASIGAAMEALLQLFVNTLSFVRVGAFALAHAGLAAAIGALAAGMHSRVLALAVLIVGNLAVIIVEGLIVGIQTTRLVLFEFFIRFLHGTGRPFRPLPPPLVPAPVRAQPRTPSPATRYP